MNIKSTQFFQLALVFLYLASLLSAQSLVGYTLLIFLGLLLTSLKKWNRKLGLTILSILITLPLFWYVTANTIRNTLEYGTLLFLLYAVFYAYLLRDLWHHIKDEKFFASLIGLFALFLGTLAGLEEECGYIPEKGFSEAQLAFCKTFNNLNPFEPDGFSGIFSVIFVYPTVILILALLFLRLYQFFEERAKHPPKKEVGTRRIFLFSGLILGVTLFIDPFSLPSKVAMVLNPIPILLTPSWWLSLLGFDVPVYILIFGYGVFSILLSGTVWYLIGYYRKWLWAKKWIVIPLYALLMALSYWLMHLY